MQSLISANAKSITQSKFEESGSYMPLYANEPTYPSLGIQYQKVSPYITVGTNPHDKSITFKLPAGAGFLYEASLGLTCAYAKANTETNVSPIGINLIRSVEWLSNGQTISYKTGNAILAMIKTWKDPSYQKFALRNARMLDTATEAVLTTESTATSFTTYCPLPESFLAESEKCLLLNKINDLQLRITFNTAAQAGLLANIGTFTPFLYVQTYMPKLSVYQQMVEADWSKRLVMEAMNTYTEVVPLAVGTSTTYKITCPFLVFKTHMFIKSSVATEATGGNAAKRINALTLNVNGTTFCDAMPLSRLNSCSSKHGTSCETVNYADSEVVMFDEGHLTVDWGVLCGRGQNTGTAFLQELQGSNLKITHATTAITDSLYIVHEYFNCVAYDNGVLSIDSNN